MTDKTKEKIFIGYRLRLFLLAVVVIFFAGLLITNIRQTKTEHLIAGSGDLNHHIISDLKSDINPDIIFLGSSPNHNIQTQMKTLRPPRKVYDLSVQNGNLVTSLAFQYLSRPMKAKTYLMGMDLSDLYLDPIWAAPIENQMQNLKQTLPPALFEILDEKITFKHKLFFKMNLWAHLLSQNLISTRDVFTDAQLKFYGNDVSQKNTTNTLDPYLKTGLQAFVVPLWDYAPQIFAELKKSIEKENGNLFVYLTPVRVNSKEEKLDRQKMYDQLKVILKNQGITTLDYVDYFESKPEAHLDIIHLNEKASKEIAEKILKDLNL